MTKPIWSVSSNRSQGVQPICHNESQIARMN
jgi:hypothetical protein